MSHDHVQKSNKRKQTVEVVIITVEIIFLIQDITFIEELYQID
jgi:hypothetical protein